MAKHLSVLRRFEVDTEQDDGWIDLKHRWRDCDWTGWVDNRSLPAIMRQATAHAKVCDGKPQPRKPSQPSVLGDQFMSIWGGVLKQALERSFVYQETKPVTMADVHDAGLVIVTGSESQ